MLLSAARTRVLNTVDDADQEQWDTTEVDAALETGQFEALSWAVAAGSNLFTQETTLSTNSSGQLSLTTQKPLKIVNVSMLSGNSRVKVPPVGLQDVCQPYSGVQSLIIAYVPRPTFPAGASSSFVWGHANVTNPLLDQLMCCIAASELKIKEGEVLAGLEKRKDELKASLKSFIAVPSFRVLPMRSSASFGSGLQYAMTAPDTLQLFY